MRLFVFVTKTAIGTERMHDMLAQNKVIRELPVGDKEKLVRAESVDEAQKRKEVEKFFHEFEQLMRVI